MSISGKIKNFFSTPNINDAYLYRKAKILNALWLSLWITNLLYLISSFFLSKYFLGSFFLILLITALLLIVGFLKNFNYINEASWLFISFFWLLLIIFSSVAGGILGPGSAFYVAIVVMAGLLLGKNKAILFAFITIIVAIVLIIITKYFPIPQLFPMAYDSLWPILTYAFILTLIPISLYLRDIDENFTKLQELSNNLEGLVQERTDQLEKSNNELKFFSYAISHDLKSPLQKISAISDLIMSENSELDDTIFDLQRQIKNNSDRSLVLIDDLLKFALLFQQKLNKELINMNKIVNNVMKLFETDITKKHINMTIGELPQCMADESLITQVWINLLSNAIKYSLYQSAPRIEINSFPEDDKNIYFIKDNGIGFDMKYYDSLFSEFKRLTSAPEYSGTGIGLSITKRIIDRHEGKIWANSRPNNGAIFYFYL